MRLCFIDIVSKRSKGTKSIKKDSIIFKSFDTIAREHPFLAKLDLELAKLLMNNCEFKLIKQTHKLYYQGDKQSSSDWFYIILFGKIWLVRQNEEDESKRIIGAYRVGRTIGEDIIVDKNYEKRLETCIASEDSAVLCIPVSLIKRIRVGLDLKTVVNPTVHVEKLIACLRRYFSEKKAARIKYSMFYNISE